MKRPPVAKTEPVPSTQIVLPARFVIIGVVGILLLSSWLLWAWFFPGYGAGVDEAAYMLQAKGLATRFDTTYLNPDPLIFMPETMIETGPGIFQPTYPIGFPLIAAIAYRIAGPGAAFAASPVMLLTALVGIFLLARQFLEDLFALAVIFLLATHPTLTHFGVSAMSHASDLAFCAWALYFACAWWKSPAAWKLALAGFCAGYAVGIRYTEALLILPLAYVALLRLNEARKSQTIRPKHILAHIALAILGGILGLLPLLWFQWHAFGSPFTSSYAYTGQSGAFSIRYFFDHFFFALKTLVSIPTGLFIWFPLGIVALFLRKWVPARQALFLALAALPTFVLYTSYYWVNRVEPVMYVRFFLTLFPLLIIAALMPVDAFTRCAAIPRYAAIAAVVIVATINLSLMPDQANIGGTAATDLAASRLAQRSLPKDAVVVSDGYAAYSLVYYTDMTVIYPVYFSESWVRDRLNSVQGVAGQVTELNALRAERFGALVRGRNQTELYDLLEQKLLELARGGRDINLLTREGTGGDQPWFSFLQRSFNFEPRARDEESKLILFSLRAK